MSVQKYNAELVSLLAADFFRRDESNVGWVNALSAMTMLPGLIGAWPMSTTNSTGAAIDVSGNGKTLTNNNTVTFSQAVLTPFTVFVAASSEYFSRADEADLDITGTETHIDAASRGLTIMTWAYANALGSQHGLVSKWTTLGNNRSYRLIKLATNDLRFEVSSAGTAGSVVQVDTTGTITAGDWFFVAGRFDPSAEMSIWLADQEDTNAVAIPASVFNSTAQLDVGRTDAGSYLDGRMGMTVLCSAALSNFYIRSFYYQTAVLFENQ